MKIIMMVSALLLLLTGCSEEEVYKSVINARAKQAKLVKKSKTISDNLIVKYYENNVDSDNTLVLLHGFGDDKDTWLQLAVALGNRYHLIIPDFIGFGDSSKPSGIDYSLEKQSDRLHEFLSQINRDSFVLVGNSMGGGIATKYAEKYPLDKLVLVSSLGPKVEKSYFDHLPQTEREELVYGVCNKSQMYKLLDLLLQRRPFGTSSIINYLAEKRCNANNLIKEQSPNIFDSQMIIRNDIFNKPLNIDVPTLIVWGKKDKMLDVSTAYEIKKQISDSTLKIYNNVGHVAMQERPYRLARDIKQFLGTSSFYFFPWWK